MLYSFNLTILDINIEGCGTLNKLKLLLDIKSDAINNNVRY